MSYEIMPRDSVFTTLCLNCCLVMSLAHKSSLMIESNVVHYFIMSESSELVLQHGVGMPGAFAKDGRDWSSGSPGRQDLTHTAESSLCSLGLAVSMMHGHWRGRKTPQA